MRPSVLTSKFVLIVLAACLAVIPAAALPGLLDGKVFIGDAGEKGKPADEKDDVITFQDGMFHSKVCDQWGYSKGAYRATAEGDVITFETETVSPKDGRLVWKGTVKGDSLEGVFTHYRKPWLLRRNPAPIEHWVKAKLKP